MHLNFALFFISIFEMISLLTGDVAFQEQYNQDIGCFAFDHINYQKVEPEYALSMDKCVEKCLRKYFRYCGVVNATLCYCGSKLNTQGPSSCNLPCLNNSMEICGGLNAISIRSTGYLVPGPPDNVKEMNILENAIELTWTEPQAPNGNILNYDIQAHPLETFANKIALPSHSWSYSGNTTKAELLGLHSGTNYNFSISAVNDNGIGKGEVRAVWTEIGSPPIPDVPVVLLTEKNKIKIHLKPVYNEYGPITSYRIVVSYDVGRLFTHEELKNWSAAESEGTPAYITAEIKPKEFLEEFFVGDGNLYGGYFNAPLSSKRHYHVSFGIISTFHEVSKASYSNFTHLSNHFTKTISIEENNDGDTVLNEILIAAIVVSALVLVLLVVAYVYLRIKLGGIVRPQNLQEMVFQGPFIDMDNNAFIDDEQENVGSEENNTNEPYRLCQDDNGQSQARFSLNSSGVFSLVGFVDKFLMDPTQSIKFEGLYGPIFECTVKNPSTSKMTKALTLKIDGDKIHHEKFLGDLFLHTFCKHHNIIQILGLYMESKNTYHIIMDNFSFTLKHMLLQYRNAIKINFNASCEKPGKFLQIAIGIAEGVQHLYSREVVHNRLCARNILIENGNVPKIYNFAVTTTKKPADISYSRWQPPSELRQTSNEDNDVWSFGVLMWEIFSIGATPYLHKTNEDLMREKIRPPLPKIDYIPDSLNKTILDCTTNSVERLKIHVLVQVLKKIAVSGTSGFLGESLPSSFEDLNNFPFNLNLEGYSLNEQSRFNLF